METSSDRSHGSLQSGPATSQVTDNFSNQSFTLDPGKYNQAGDAKWLTITEPNWNCKCVCCVSMRVEYHQLAQMQTFECGKMWMNKCEVYKAQLKLAEVAIKQAEERIKYLEELKVWRDFTNLGGSQ